MGSSKRKRQSTDSAIADMSSKELFTEESQTRAISQNSSSLSSIVTSEDESQFKRRKKTLPFDVRNFRTAASQRPRSGTPERLPKVATSQCLPQKSRQKPVEQVATATQQAACGKVNGNNENRRQKPRRKQVPIALPTPPQTAEMSITQAASQFFLRRSTRETRPTERFQQASIEQETPCKQQTRGSASIVTSDQIGRTPATLKGKSRIVRLRLRSLLTQSGGSQMSFTGSFSHLQKSNQEQDSQTSLPLVGLRAVREMSRLLTCNRMKASTRIAASRIQGQRPLRSHSQTPYSRTARICTLRSSRRMVMELL